MKSKIISKIQKKFIWIQQEEDNLEKEKCLKLHIVGAYYV